jgi:hypothetical protein
MIEVVIPCRRCDREFALAYMDWKKGGRRLCPDCREPPPKPPRRRPLADPNPPRVVSTHPRGRERG